MIPKGNGYAVIKVQVRKAFWKKCAKKVTIKLLFFPLYPQYASSSTGTALAIILWKL